MAATKGKERKDFKVQRFIDTPGKSRWEIVCKISTTDEGLIEELLIDENWQKIISVKDTYFTIEESFLGNKINRPDLVTKILDLKNKSAVKITFWTKLWKKYQSLAGYARWFWKNAQLGSY
jgi:hypothetical protein